MSRPSAPETAPLRKQVTVPQEPDEAFRLFTVEIAAWWPLATHSVGTDTATGVVVEPGPGGRIVETYGEGRTAVWGTITTWDPPARVAFTWHPGADAAEATDVEVTFTPADGGGTAVELVHSGWERRAEGAAVRRNYDAGWDLVLGRYVDRAGAH